MTLSRLSSDRGGGGGGDAAEQQRLLATAPLAGLHAGQLSGEAVAREGERDVGHGEVAGGLGEVHAKTVPVVAPRQGRGAKAG